MGKPTGFMEFPRSPVPYVDTKVRLKTWDEITGPWTEEHLRDQGARVSGKAADRPRCLAAERLCAE